MLLHPEVATRDCEECRRHEFNHKTGEPIKRGGQPIKRPPKGPGSLPPCLTGIECAKGVYRDTNELSEKNAQAYYHYRRCKAVGIFPDDPIVAANALIIKTIEDTIDDERSRLNQSLLRAVASTKGK